MGSFSSGSRRGLAEVRRSLALTVFVCLMFVIGANGLKPPYPYESWGSPQRNLQYNSPPFVDTTLAFSESASLEPPTISLQTAVFPDGAPLDFYPMAAARPFRFPQDRSFSRVINNQLVHGYVVQVPDPIGKVSVEEPLNGCPGLIRTSVSAEQARCKYAMNAGFFDVYRGTCLGHVVSNGKTVESKLGRIDNAVFGILKNGSYAVGYVTKADVSAALPFQQLVSGVTYLIRAGEVSILTDSIAYESPDYDFVWEKAPRTAIGFNQAGELLLAEVDGDEALNKGLDLFEWANLLHQFGFYYAVNLDGGGSTVLVRDTKSISRPSDYCATNPGARCERAVTTFICVRS
eukprot:ANDGO_05865.mRNA.1 hypothetical protein CAOG_02765